jgi:hypothetical protein
MNKVKLYIKDVPFILLAVDFISWVLSLFGLFLYDYWWITEIASHSLLLVGFMAFYAYVHKYCLYSWICIGGLALINLLNIVHYFLDLQYIHIYVGLIIIPCLTFAIIKWRQKYFKP